MHFVKALEDACWLDSQHCVRKAVIAKRTDGQNIELEAGVFVRRSIVRALVEERWSIDNKSVEVEPGLVVSFALDEDAKYFQFADRKTPPRAEPVFVKMGDIVAFHFQEDAQFQIDAKRASHMSLEQVQAEYAAANQGLPPADADGGIEDTATTPEVEAGANEGDRDVDKEKFENKGTPEKAETKEAAPKAPKAAKPAAKKGK